MFAMAGQCRDRPGPHATDLAEADRLNREELAILILLGAWVALGLGYFIRRTRWGVRAFDRSPRREGGLLIADGLAAVGLWLVGQVAAAWLLGVNVPRDELSSSQMLRNLLVGMIGGLPAIVYVLGRAGVACRDGLAGFGLGWRRAAGGRGGLVRVGLFIVPATLATLVATKLICDALKIPTPEIAHDVLVHLAKAPPGIRWGLAVVAIVGAPVYEELIFRGMLQTALQQSRIVPYRWPAIIFTAAGFAVIHGPPYQTWPGLFVLALGLGYVYERTGSLWYPMVIHALFNALNVLLVVGGVVEQGGGGESAAVLAGG
jgi:hypothetical protein